MTKLLQEVFNKIEQLNPQIQDAIASRLLEELEDEKKGNSSFVNITDKQEQKMADTVKQENKYKTTEIIELFGTIEYEEKYDYKQQRNRE
jgi:hypothetical protein